MIRKAAKKIEYLVKSSRAYNKEAWAELEREGKFPQHDEAHHLKETLEWIKRAQDVYAEGGVARGYSAAWNKHFNGKGWQPPYPETTGYIIPTFFEAARLLNDKELAERAVRMADWETGIQMKNGAVRGGAINPEDPIPSVFCTGQVIFGWARAYEETKNRKYLDAGNRAGGYLLSVQDKNGCYHEDARYDFARKDTTVYHTRVAWSMAVLGTSVGNDDFISSAEKNILYNLKFQQPNGWFANNCLYDPDRPLLHTICYAIRGVLETGLLLNNEGFIAAAKTAADNLLVVTEEAAFPPGRLDGNWKGTVDWSCLTGDAQLAIIFLRLHQRTSDARYALAAQKLIDFIKTTQNCADSNPGIRGGIKGSYPFNGRYGTFQMLNWAAKFYADALLLDMAIKQNMEYKVHG